ncbi:hypothetical protein EJ08DRAFT_701102 [Tothia fuscella]|uniref:Uncharacterized protein n=1 Tax=Tothia fuscella TaxID=1048955 RepID=A0A9P4NJ89_9PEZI|nr:hypothetical protein EJ08DRAFT_701102 [Tothia fuscella]
MAVDRLDQILWFKQKKWGFVICRRTPPPSPQSDADWKSFLPSLPANEEDVAWKACIQIIKSTVREDIRKLAEPLTYPGPSRFRGDMPVFTEEEVEEMVGNLAFDVREEFAADGDNEAMRTDFEKWRNDTQIVKEELSDDIISIYLIHDLTFLNSPVSRMRGPRYGYLVEIDDAGIESILLGGTVGRRWTGVYVNLVNCDEASCRSETDEETGREVDMRVPIKVFTYKYLDVSDPNSWEYNFVEEPRVVAGLLIDGMVWVGCCETF